MRYRKEMIGRPDRSEAAKHYFSYIDQVQTDDIFTYLDKQTTDLSELFGAIGEEQSLSRYAPDKWSFREVLQHVNDAERVFAFRALWVGRGSEPELPSFDENLFALNVDADSRSWASHVEEFRAVRAASTTLLRTFPAEAWSRVGTIGGHRVTTRAIVFMLAGHAEHHRRILAERYL